MILLNDGSYKTEWVAGSKAVEAFVDFAKPFNVFLSSQPIHNHLVSICENHFGSLRSGINDSWQGFFEVEVSKLNESTLLVNVTKFITELSRGIGVNKELGTLHNSEHFIAFISCSDKRNVALIVAPAYYQATTSTIGNQPNVKQSGKDLSADAKILAEFFVKHCCAIGGGITRGGIRIGGLEVADSIHEKSFLNLEKINNSVAAQVSLSVSTEVGDIESLLNEAMLFKDSEFFEPFCERLKFLIDTQSALVPGVAFYRDGSTATACELVIPLKPADSLICLFSALRAEDGDFRSFDHEYSFSQSLETKQ